MNNENRSREISKTHKFGHILGSIFSPATITVIITAIVGPLAIQKTVNKIENKKIQSTVIEKVLECTDKANFADPSEVARAGYIAKMGSENKDVFGLTFSQAESAFVNLTKSLKDLEITDLNVKIAERSSEIVNLNSIVAKKSDELSILRNENTKMKTLLKTAGQRGRRGRRLKDSLQNEINVNETKIVKYQQEYNNTSARLEKLEMENKANKKLLEDKNKHLVKLQEEYEKNQNETRSQMQRNKQLANDVEALKKELNSVTEKWKKTNEDIIKWKQMYEAEKKKADQFQQAISIQQKSDTTLNSAGKKVAPSSS